jgi:hypothetical protein
MALPKRIIKVAKPLSWHYCGYIQDGSKFIHIFEDGQGHVMYITTNSATPPALGPAN